MSTRSLNPNHQVSQTMQEHALQVLALVVHKIGGKCHLTMADLEQISGGPNLFVVFHEKTDGLHISLVDESTAHTLARREGGLPV
jgi:hypothetical protein